MKIFNRETIFDKQIDVFLHYCISQGIREGTYNFWLKEFGKKFRGNVYNIEKEDVDDFLADVSVLYNGQHALDQADRAIRGMIRYYHARGRNIGKRSVSKLKATTPLTV